MTDDYLMEAQKDLEQRATTDGYARFIKQQDTTSRNEGPYATKDASKVIRGCIPLVSKEISRWLEVSDRKGKGRTHVALKTLSGFDPDLLAYVALNAVFSGLTHKHSVAAVQVHIGSTLEQEVIAQELEVQRGKAVAKRIQQYVSRQGSSRNRRKVFSKLVTDNEVEHEEWSQEFKLKVGEPLVNAVLLSLSDLFELHTLSEGKKAMKVTIRLTDAGVSLLSELRESIAWLMPIHRPMVVKPRPWTSYDTGCYYDEKASRTVKLVRTYSKLQKKLVRQAIADGSMEYVLEALNAIQETPWAINTKVLNVVRWAYENDIAIPGLPQRSVVPLPDRMPAEKWDSLSDTERKGYLLQLSGIREKNRSIVADSAVVMRDLETAKELAKYERFYLPHNLDFRGRVYPVPHFSHQRSDHIKALFAFADAAPVESSGGAWLAVHLANCGDFERVSKRSFEDRLAWVDANEELILKVASDPTGTTSIWGEADSPFMFLAACFEYAEYIRSGKSPGFTSRLPVALDGSNSGLQHYSAALRATDEASLVSLIPSERPADLYQTVADYVCRSAASDAQSGDSVAELCVANGITRSLVKRNVMTFAYSSEQFGFRQQLMSDWMKPLSDQVLMGKLDKHPYDLPREDGSMDGGFKASGYLAKKVWEGVTSVVKRASEGMKFFQDVAGAMASEGKPMVWISPVGLPVVHQYDQWDTKQVRLQLYDKAVPVSSATPDDVLDPDGRGVLARVRTILRSKPSGTLDLDKMRSAVAPNVIHSMDAAHLMLTVLSAKGIGISDFALIHDSFATHAGKTEEFFHVIREAFVDMYEGYDPFQEVLEQAASVLSDEGQDRLPMLPEKGDMDLSVVLEARYAFA